jgi:membrane-associated phospholipid phosphatase
MYSESLLITLALNQSVKTNSPRIRPFVYNNNAPDKEKTDKDAVKSFYSGHTAFAFNTAVFLSYVFGEYYPKSPLRYVIWPTSLLLAGSIAFARVRAGKHFPTDVIVGAALGGFSGFLVPYLHRNKETSVSFVPLFGETNGVAFIKRF